MRGRGGPPGRGGMPPRGGMARGGSRFAAPQNRFAAPAHAMFGTPSTEESKVTEKDTNNGQMMESGTADNFFVNSTPSNEAKQPVVQPQVEEQKVAQNPLEFLDQLGNVNNQESSLVDKAPQNTAGGMDFLNDFIHPKE